MLSAAALMHVIKASTSDLKENRDIKTTVRKRDPETKTSLIDDKKTDKTTSGNAADAKTDKKDMDISKFLFIVPMGYDGETQLMEPDYELHVGKKEAALFQSDGTFTVHDPPDGFRFATTGENRVMHYQTLLYPDGKKYIPLFDSYKAAVSIYGKNIRISAICFETAVRMCVQEKLDGVVISPGISNVIVSAKKASEAADKETEDSHGSIQA